MVAVNKTKNQIRVLMTNVLTSSGRFILFHYPHPQGEGEEGLHPTGVKGDHKAKPVPVRRKKGASSMCTLGLCFLVGCQWASAYKSTFSGVKENKNNIYIYIYIYICIYTCRKIQFA